MSRQTGLNEHRYRELLHQHLVDRPVTEVEFFVNPRRFDILHRLLLPQLQGKKILNVASGPFAFEFYTPPVAARVDSLDIDRALSGLHSQLVDEGLIRPSQFTHSDAMSFETNETYDVVLINDLFYSRHVDFYDLIAKYSALCRPGGLVYFDILDERAGPVWRLFKRDGNFRRYDMASVRQTLNGHGLSIEAEAPSLGIKGGVDGILRRSMWMGARIANNLIFLTQKSPGPASRSTRQPEPATTPSNS